MVRPGRVVVTGSSECPKQHVAFATEFGRRLITETDFVLVTGGLASKGSGLPPAIDGIVTDAAVEALGGMPASLESRIITILPESDVSGFQRLGRGTVVRVQYASTKTRRYSMVLTSDAIVAIHGSEATKEILDLGYVAGKPIIPFPTTDGAALEIWNRYKPELVQRLRMTDADINALNNARDSSGAITACLKTLVRALRPRCFVAMPFANHPLANVFETIRAAAEKAGYQVIRVDQESFTGNIIDVIWDSIRNSDFVIADLTDHKPNVYYETGISHALNKPTVLTVFDRDGQIPVEIPFDLRVHRLIPYGTTQSLARQLDDILPHVTRQPK